MTDEIVNCPRPGCGRKLSKKGLPRHAMSQHVRKRGIRCEEPGCSTPGAGMAKDGKIYCDGHMTYHR
jgi:hypothetical protein